MKNIITFILLILTLSVKGQQTDVMYSPKDNSIIGTYNFRQVGMYVGAYYITTNPQPFMYTTPLTIMNRIGMTYVNKENTYSIMVGGFFNKKTIETDVIPDFWLKIFPLRTITKNSKLLDITLGVNYSNNINYAVGISVPF